MNDELMLVEPSEEYFAELAAYRNDFLENSDSMDGCGPLRTFVQVMIPNASSSFLTVFLFSVVWYWNDYYVSSTFFTKNQTIALMLKNLSTCFPSSCSITQMSAPESRSSGWKLAA